MAITAPTVNIYFTGSATDVSGYVKSFRIGRGRDNPLDDISAGTCAVTFVNHLRRFDPLYAAGPYYGNLVPTKRITVAVGATTIFDGTIDDWDDEEAVGGAALATATAVDALGRLAAATFTEWQATTQAAGARITAVLARPEVAYAGTTALDVGGWSYLLNDFVTSGTNVLNYLQLVARTDWGRFYASRTNVLTFKDRHTLISSTAESTFVDNTAGAPAGRPYNGVRRRNAAEMLYTFVSIERDGGEAQTATDATAVTAYGVRTLALSGLLLSSESDALDMANYLLFTYKAPSASFELLDCEVSSLSVADRADVLELDIGSPIRIVRTPHGIGSSIDQTVVVEGVEHTFDVHDLHRVTFHVSEVNQIGEQFTLDSATLGVLDSDTLGF